MRLQGEAVLLQDHWAQSWLFFFVFRSMRHYSIIMGGTVYWYTFPKPRSVVNERLISV